MHGKRKKNSSFKVAEHSFLYLCLIYYFYETVDPWALKNYYARGKLKL